MSAIEKLQEELENQGFRMEECFGSHSSVAPEDSKGFVEKRIAFVLYPAEDACGNNVGPDVCMDILWDSTGKQGWDTFSTLLLDSELLKDESFRKFVLKVAGVISAAGNYAL